MIFHKDQLIQSLVSMKRSRLVPTLKSNSSEWVPTEMIKENHIFFPSLILLREESENLAWITNMLQLTVFQDIERDALSLDGVIKLLPKTEYQLANLSPELGL